jgi:transketolase
MDSIELSKKIRIESLKMVHRINGSHIGSAFSMVDILSVLYSNILNFDHDAPELFDRDRFILSKGHACSSLYACLALKGFFSLEDLKKYGKNDSNLMNHVSHKVPGVEFSTGSLGHGLPFGLGKALGLKLNKINSRVYVLIGDGELAEGSNFEAMLLSAHHKLDNLVLIIDHNNLQSLTTVDKTLKLKPFKDKFEAFGWNYSEVDGHNHNDLKCCFEGIKEVNNKPSVILANTIKGKGVKFMEDKVEWHYKAPNDEELKIAIKQIQNA